ncbi:hypothetical protein G6F46_000191 [Rhizopus delemar]|uniref:Uncharacterized protein n=2 Tax=Rhizopus TaxID=4842 RepID=A0A9P6Z7G6_9FUNG|nr:hypothetical protein G6F43_004972 [Rhizopus delemar]KAG1550293.1 hypothetical protein G6F51_002525 [Rhizopus arrhizus]KAG1459939.1 hypothetical protein G6F55_004463 [Rhizopus delemar]KAG1505060.1 hypothetical protein G6F54_000575 [Rhizopus delemar]KAG1510599.1 hypothetical protein G6F53_006564 [Rhizopus delemar]
MSTLFVRQGEDTVENTNDLLELVISELQEKHNILHSHYSQLGKGFEKTIKPWALVFCKNIEDIEKTFHEESQEAEQKTWLDLIRICRVETAHQLRAVLCGIHIKPNTIGEEIDILRWIEEEKNGQPPSIVVVIDLFDLMLSNKSDNEYAETLRYLSIK